MSLRAASTEAENTGFLRLKLTQDDRLRLFIILAVLASLASALRIANSGATAPGNLDVALEVEVETDAMLAHPAPRLRARAAPDIVVLPDNAPTLWNGTKSARAQRDAAPEWVADMLDAQEPTPIAEALTTPPRVIALSAPRDLSPFGAASPDGLIDLPPHIAADVAPDAPEPAQPAQFDDFAPLETGSIEPSSPLELKHLSAPRPIRRPALRRVFPVEAHKATATDGGRPQIILILTAVGVDPSASRDALQNLPTEIAVAVAPIAANPAQWVTEARGGRRVVLAEAPMEPESRRAADPGPLTLRTSAGPEANLKRLEALLTLLPNVDGVATYLGDRFTADEDALLPVLTALQERNLFLIETAPGPLSRVPELSREIGLSSAASVVSLDKSGRTRDISDGLALLEAEALRRGRAIGVAVAMPSTVRALREWTKTAEERGFQLTPLRL